MANPFFKKNMSKASDVFLPKYTPKSGSYKNNFSGGSSAVMHKVPNIQRIRNLLQRRVALPKAINYAKYGLFAPAFSTQGVFSGTVNTFKAIPGAFRSGYSSIYEKTLSRRLAKVATATGLGVAGYGLAKYGASGNPKDLIPSTRVGADVAGFGISPIPAFVGFASGLGESGIKKAKNVFGYAKDVAGLTGGMTSIGADALAKVGKDAYDNAKAHEEYLYEKLQQGLGFSAPPVTYIGGDTMVSTPQGGGFSPSVTIGGGGGGNEALMFALLAGGALAGVGGYALGRRKKRKKYKRKKARR